MYIWYSVCLSLTYFTWYNNAEILSVLYAAVSSVPRRVPGIGQILKRCRLKERMRKGNVRGSCKACLGKTGRLDWPEQRAIAEERGWKQHLNGSLE